MTLPVVGSLPDAEVSGTLFPREGDALAYCGDFWRFSIANGALLAEIPRGLPEGSFRLGAMAGKVRVLGVVEGSPRRVRLDTVISEGVGGIEVQVTGAVPRFDGTSWTPEFVTVWGDGLQLSQRPSRVGLALFDDMPVGTYLVEANYGGCARSRRAVVTADQKSRVEIRLSEERPYILPWLGAEFDKRRRLSGELVLGSLHPDGLLARLGARPGDTVTSINGIPAEHIVAQPSCVVGFAGRLSIGLEGRSLYWDDPSYASEP